MNLDTQRLEEKLEKANPPISDLYDILFFDDTLFEKTFGIKLGEKRGVEIREQFVIECFCVAFGLEEPSDLKNLLKEYNYSDLEVNLILKSFDFNFITAFKELNKKNESQADKFEEIKKVNTEQENSISHHDVLSEIENPTPSINTTANFQTNAVKSAGMNNSATSSTTSTKTTDISKTPLTPVNLANPSTASLHSSASVAPYSNPALNIASKLDQKLSTPSASIPKDIYVSKKPDPYHEPVDL